MFSYRRQTKLGTNRYGKEVQMDNAIKEVFEIGNPLDLFIMTQARKVARN